MTESNMVIKQNNEEQKIAQSLYMEKLLTELDACESKVYTNYIVHKKNM